MSVAVNEKTEEKPKESAGDFFKVIFQALLIALVIRTLLFQPFVIPSGSMIPTLLIGDYLFVSKMSYGYSKYSLPFSPDLFEGRIWSDEPERGDVAVFRPNNKIDTDYIKRVIGLPGDTVQMKDGELYINGEAVKREAAGEFKPNGQYGNRALKLYREILPNGVTYMTADEGPTLADNTKVFEVPKGHYFMMGDNRDNSSDSRFGVGYVPLENFVGKANVIFFSLEEGSSFWQFWKWPWAIRFSRIFQGL
jgi:signal peptidase I